MGEVFNVENSFQHKFDSVFTDRFWIQQGLLWKKYHEAMSNDYVYIIDVVGRCNLRCPSCAVGNLPAVNAKANMPLSEFVKIADKISADPKHTNPIICLYNWGEAPLHKDLDKILLALGERGIKSEISTNLNVFPNMERVLLAGLGALRISISGFQQDTYGLTHKEGNISNVLMNMHKLREIISRHGLQTSVQVGFHVYRHNFPNDFLEIARLCEKLNFLFQPTIASMSPLEVTTKVAEGNIPDEVQEVNDLLVIPIADYRHLLHGARAGNEQCWFKTSTTAINADGSVALCCATYDRMHVIAPSFLSSTEGELNRGMREAEFCAICAKHNLDLLYTGRRTAAFDEAVFDVLGNEYKEFDRQLGLAKQRAVVTTQASDHLIEVGGGGDASIAQRIRNRVAQGLQRTLRRIF